MRAFVGVTDDKWYEFLASRPDLSEVNFWRPSGQGFGSIATGEPFLFKTHSPGARLVGGGFLSGSDALRLSEAWEIFGEANGVGSLAELQVRIARYRREQFFPGYDPLIGCILLRNVFFVSPERGIAPPPDWSSNIVVGKTYDLASSQGSYLERALEDLLKTSGAGDPLEVAGPMFGTPHLIAPRLGQQAFKALVLTAYNRRCAITGAKIQPTLEAAHIRPVANGGQHRVDNGMLLRSDIHTLFDRGYVGVDPQRRLRVSPRLRSEFGNGEDLYARAGNTLPGLPQRPVDRPDREVLEWHMDSVFLSA